jgi:hypothetical protein
MFNIKFGAGTIEAGAASCCGSGSNKMMLLLAALALKQWKKQSRYLLC